jgi:hypothetical protein
MWVVSKMPQTHSGITVYAGKNHANNTVTMVREIKNPCIKAIFLRIFPFNLQESNRGK